jgi:hypothetical protein
MRLYGSDSVSVRRFDSMFMIPYVGFAPLNLLYIPSFGIFASVTG